MHAEPFITTQNAQVVAERIDHLYRIGSPSKLFMLEITDLDGSNPQELWVRPRLDQTPFGLADGRQVVNCETEDGRKVSIFVPTEHREFQPATVILEERPEAED